MSKTKESEVSREPNQKQKGNNSEQEGS